MKVSAEKDLEKNQDKNIEIKGEDLQGKVEQIEMAKTALGDFDSQGSPE